MMTKLNPIKMAVAILGLFTSLAPAALAPEVSKKIYDQATPSLVAVQYMFRNELRPTELISAGVIVSEDGLVMAPLAIFSAAIPDEQMKDFKIIVPKADADEEEIDAVFLGRDERNNVAFLRTKTKQNWKAIKFVDKAADIGQPVVSVGLLPKVAGYKSYLAESVVSAHLRGDVPTVLVSGGMAAMGAVVFNADGEAIGLVQGQQGQTPVLNDPQRAMDAIKDPPKWFVPASDFLSAFDDLPVEGKPQQLPWLGVVQLAGVEKDVAEFFGLKNKPAVELGDVIAGGPAEKAGLKRGDKILKVNGKVLERGDQPSELPAIMSRQLRRMKPGDTVTLSVVGNDPAKKEPREVAVTLDAQPKRANLAERFWADDLGFTARELVFGDTYTRKLPADQKGVVVALIKPQGSAENARLRREDLITEINSTPVTDVNQFKAEYQKLRKDKPKDAVVLMVLRDGNTQVIRIEPPQ